MKRLRVTLVAASLAVLGASSLVSALPRAHGGLVGNMTLTWTLLGQGRFKVELFEVGGPYPSRQKLTPEMKSLLEVGWSELVRNEYFMRVTKCDKGNTVDSCSGPSKQTGAFIFDPNRDHSTLTLDWKDSRLMTGYSGLSPSR